MNEAIWDQDTWAELPHRRMSYWETGTLGRLHRHMEHSPCLQGHSPSCIWECRGFILLSLRVSFPLHMLSLWPMDEQLFTDVSHQEALLLWCTLASLGSSSAAAMLHVSTRGCSYHWPSNPWPSREWQQLKTFSLWPFCSCCLRKGSAILCVASASSVTLCSPPAEGNFNFLSP